MTRSVIVGAYRIAHRSTLPLAMAVACTQPLTTAKTISPCRPAPPAGSAVAACSSVSLPVAAAPSEDAAGLGSAPYVPRITIEGLGPPYDGPIVAWHLLRTGCYLCLGNTRPLLEAAPVATRNCRRESDHDGVLVGVIPNGVALLETETDSLTVRPLQMDSASAFTGVSGGTFVRVKSSWVVDAKGATPPGNAAPTAQPVSSLPRTLLLPRPSSDGLQGISVDETSVALLYSSPSAVFWATLTGTPRWDVLAPPQRLPQFTPRLVWTKGTLTVVKYSHSMPVLGSLPPLLRVYKDGGPILDVYGEVALCGSPLHERGLDLVVRGHRGPVLRRYELPFAGDPVSVNVPLDSAWCVATSGDAVAVSGARGRFASIALYRHGRWFVKDVEPLQKGVQVALGLAFDGKRLLVGSPESPIAPPGRAYLFRASPHGGLSSPVVLAHSGDEAIRPVLFGKSLFLVPQGPVLIGWHAYSSLATPNSWATHYRSFTEPCR